eukprot:28531-Pelagococcus_subviridis.AAC.2
MSLGGENRREKSLRNGVHHANAVVWEPLRRLTTLFGRRTLSRPLLLPLPSPPPSPSPSRFLPPPPPSSLPAAPSRPRTPPAASSENPWRATKRIEAALSRARRDGDGGDGKEILLDRRELNVDVLDIALREANARVRALEMEMTTHAAAATVEKKRSEALRARSETLQRELDRAWALVGGVKVEEKSRRDGEARPE